jgi:hypothetical protein
MSVSRSAARGVATALGAADVVVSVVLGMAFVLTDMRLAYAFVGLSVGKVPVVAGFWTGGGRRRWGVPVFGAAFAATYLAGLTVLVALNAALFAYAIATVLDGRVGFPRPA